VITCSRLPSLLWESDFPTENSRSRNSGQICTVPLPLCSLCPFSTPANYIRGGSSLPSSLFLLIGEIGFPLMKSLTLFCNHFSLSLSEFKRFSPVFVLNGLMPSYHIGYLILFINFLIGKINPAEWVPPVTDRVFSDFSFSAHLA
jgi:hypothetical protein